MTLHHSNFNPTINPQHKEQNITLTVTFNHKTQKQDNT